MSTRASNVPQPLSPSSPWKVVGRRRVVGATVVICAVATALVSTMEARPIAMAGAVAIGWSHLVGRCGISHFGALTPRGKVPGRRGRWLTGALVYLAAGALASSAVGAALAAGGGVLVPADFRAAAVGLALLLAAVAAASELGVIRWRLPQPNLQTRRQWGMYRSPIPEALWGFCLGLTFATVFTFSGTWLVLALPIASGEPAFGAMVLLAHWVGRTTPILMGPLFVEHPGRMPELLDDIEGARSVFRTSNVVGIALMGVSLLILLQDVAS